MSFFDTLVDEAIRNSPELAVLRPVVEKELLHHDILRLMSDSGLLVKLTFIGGYQDLHDGQERVFGKERKDRNLFLFTN